MHLWIHRRRESSQSHLCALEKLGPGKNFECTCYVINRVIFGTVVRTSYAATAIIPHAIRIRLP